MKKELIFQKKNLGPLLTLKKGKKPRTQSPIKEKGMQPYVDIKAFETGVVDNYTNDDKCVPCNDGDLLIVCDGSRSGYVGRAIKGYTGSTLAKISAEGVDNSYLYYFIQSMYRLLNTQMKGTGTPHLNAEVLKKAELVIPSLDEQKRVVNSIEELFSELDSAVETLKKTKEQLTVYRQSVLKSAFDNCEKNTEMGNIATMVDPHPSHRTPPEYENGIPYIGVGDIDYKENYIRINEARKVNPSIYKEHVERYTIRPGDFIMGKIGTIGKPYRLPLPQNYVLSANVILIQPNTEKVNPEYLFWQFSSPLVVEQLMEGKNETSQPAFGIQKARLLNIKMYGRDEQNKIVQDLRLKMSVCDNIEKTVNDALAQAEAMRQSILKKAFEGDL